MSHYPTFVVSSVGGGPTDDKPRVTLETPRDPDRVSSFLNIRVKDVAAVYAEWRARGAEFLTPPKQHQYEIRCYIRERASSPHLIGTGGLGSVIARRLASGGETLRLSSADAESARMLAAAIGRGAAAASDNRDALQGADAVILALRFGVLKGVIEEIADSLTDKLVVVPSNPVGLDAHGQIVRLLPQRQSSGNVVAEWLPEGARFAMAFGSMSGDLLESSSNRSPELAVLFYATDDKRAGWQVERLIRTAGFEPVKVGGVEQSGRLEVGGDLHDLVVGPAEARSLIGGT